MYYIHYSEDALTTKFLVIAIWILDILHASLICHILYHYLITNYGALTSLEHLVWSMPASHVVNLLVVAAVQCFFAYQIYYLCRPRVKWLVTAPIILLVLTHFGFGMEVAVLIFVNNESSTLSKITSYASIPCVATRVLAEVLITLSLCILVYDKGSRSVFPRTKRLLNTLIIYAINRCFLVLLVALAELVVILCNKDVWAMGFEINIGTLYANSLPASLNTRKYLRSQGLGPRSVLSNDVVHIVVLPKFSRDGKTSKDGQRQPDLREVALIDVAAVPVLDKTTGLRRKREV
ncbi:hypothetical protein EV401DRAFT_1917271 [Pisolithus croceorrhizus]|nr:hypothetical protein EV401DRAFT_1917271 [Pisolithus croceorrhizus]